MNDRGSRRAMQRFGAILVVLTGIATSGWAASSAPQETINDFYAVLLKTMKGGAELGAKRRYDALLPAVRQDFDLRFMSRIAVGVIWSALASAQKQRVTDALARYIAATYASNFDSYSGERFEVNGRLKTLYGTVVESRLIQPDGHAVRMNYLMRRNDDAWEIGDIYLTGTISQLANWRSQFSSVLAREGVDGLIASLNHKADMLLADNNQ
jgi:phospholipid transport system substrate-binding protein